ncbi:hypothetical protein Dxin01_02892 [Deinococcus xinjiangensis]|uniref:DUF11 domain-containing protein n=1 Tax=Deinococcus xinjiangensis TaxID=457454 RepID=A0ABP9VD27_9DEIO
MISLFPFTPALENILLRSTAFCLCTLGLLSTLSWSAGQSICAAPAKDGDVTGLSGVVNTYYGSASGAVNLSAGSTSIRVGAVKRGATTDIAAGDLLLIMQMQGADINSTNTTAYGDGTAGNTTGQGQLSTTAGTYEFVVATGSVTAGSIGIRGSGAGGGLLNSYVSRDASATQGKARYQVIRVPQYGNLTLSGTLSASPWDGDDGGVVVLDVTGNLNWNGATIDLSGRGFRGGGGQALGGVGTQNPVVYTNTDWRTPSTANINGNKGEGIAGTPKYLYDPAVSTSALTVGSDEGYPNGSRGRGAPANAGGGGTDGDPSGNTQNSGGGGGGNGGAGGQGGNSWSSNLSIGGNGGAATPASLSRLFLGGGGGAGSRNNSSGVQSSGGNGGGIVIVRAGSSSGSGTVNVSGTVGVAPLEDGGGGGGAGGTAVIMVGTGTLGGLSINANGGNGSASWATQAAGTNNINAHGPGGGGGGGIIYTNVAGATTSAQNGVSGTTTTSKLTFGAQAGLIGRIGEGGLTGLSGQREGAACPVLRVEKSTSTPTVWRGAKATYTIKVTNTGGPSSVIRVQDTLPTGLVLSGSPSVSPTSSRVTNEDASSTTALDMQKFRLGYGESLSITFDALTPTHLGYMGTVFQNSATASATDAAGNPVSASYSAASSTAEDVQLLFPNLKLVKQVRNVTRDNAAGSVRFGTTGGGLPAETLEYCISYTNDGDGPLSGVKIQDSIPSNTDVLLAAYGSPDFGVKLTSNGTTTLYTSANDQATAPLDLGSLSQSGGLLLNLDTVAKGASGTVCFQTKIH